VAVCGLGNISGSIICRYMTIFDLLQKLYSELSNFDVIYKLLFGTWLRDIISSIHYVSGAVPTITAYLKITDLPIKRQPVIQ
jgi:hypothetical protein